MNTVVDKLFLDAASNKHLDWLESEAIHIMREVAAECSNPALLFSGGKDSVVMLRLAEKAFRPGKFPFPLVHIDTGHNFDEVIAFRDKRAAELGERLIVGHVEDSIKRGTVRLRNPLTDSRNAAQAVTLLETIAEYKFDACIGGARRDEEKARAKERIFSFRDEFGQWNPKAQRPELWDLYNTRVHPGENMRVFPISNWTELDVWQYIAREKLELPSIYFAHQRQVIPRNGLLVPLTPLTQPKMAKQLKHKLSVSVPWAIFRAPALCHRTQTQSTRSLQKQQSPKSPSAAQPAWTIKRPKHRWKNVKKKDISDECPIE